MNINSLILLFYLFIILHYFLLWTLKMILYNKIIEFINYKNMKKNNMHSKEMTIEDVYNNRQTGDSENGGFYYNNGLVSIVLKERSFTNVNMKRTVEEFKNYFIEDNNNSGPMSTLRSNLFFKSFKFIINDIADSAGNINKNIKKLEIEYLKPTSVKNTINSAWDVILQTLGNETKDNYLYWISSDDLNKDLLAAMKLDQNNLDNRENIIKLLNLGGDPNYPTTVSLAPYSFFYAKHLDIMKLTVNTDNVNWTDKDSHRDILMHRAWSGDFADVEYLMSDKVNANCNIQSSELSHLGFTTLDYVVSIINNINCEDIANLENGHCKIKKLLLEKGCKTKQELQNIASLP